MVFESAELPSKFKGLDRGRLDNTFHCRGWKNRRKDLLAQVSSPLFSTSPSLSNTLVSLGQFG